MRFERFVFLTCLITLIFCNACSVSEPIEDAFCKVGVVSELPEANIISRGTLTILEDNDSVSIDVGSQAIDRAGTSDIYSWTKIDTNNPLNYSGTITSIELWMAIQGANIEIATIYEVSANHFTTRDYELIGTVNASSKQTFDVNIDGEAGDFLAIHGTAGEQEFTNTSGNGYYYYGAGDLIPCTNATFTNSGVKCEMSMYGTGVTGMGDILYVCIKTLTGDYEWKIIATTD